MSVTRILCPVCGLPLCYCKCDEESLRRWNEERKDAWRDRGFHRALGDLKALVLGMRKPPWRRFVRRWKRRKLVRSMAKPQPALAGWEGTQAPGKRGDGK